MTDSTTIAHPHLAKDYKRTKPRRRPNLTLRRIIRYWPLLVWLVAVAVVVMIHGRGSHFGGMTGVVETTEELVAPIENARLMSINVTIGQRVRAGDTIAQMDTSMLEARKAALLAEQQEAQNSIAGYQQDILLLIRQFTAAINSAETEILKIEAEQSSDLAKLTELKKEQQRREELAKKNIISSRELSELKPQIAGLEQRVAAYPALLDEHRNLLKKTQAQMDNLKHWLRLKDDRNLSDAIKAKTSIHNKILDAKLAMLDLKIKSYTLTAARDGIVARIQAQPGDVIPAGREVVRLVVPTSNRVVGFLPEVFLGDVKKGTPATIWRERDGKHMDAVVESVAPDVRSLPTRITPMRGQTVRGRRVVLKINGTPDLIPGETVKIRPKTSLFSRLGL